MYKLFLLFIVVLLVPSIGLVGANLVQGGSFEAADEGAWEIYWYNADEQPEYEFGYTTDGPSLGKGACLHVWTEETANGQLLFWQRVTLTAGTTYEVSVALKTAFFSMTAAAMPPGPWFQLYLHEEEPQDPAGGAADYNPAGGKFYDITAWTAECEFEGLDGLWQDYTCGETMEGAPLYTPAGNAGEDVELIFGIKIGQYWEGTDVASFDVLIDEAILTLEGQTGSPDVSMEMVPQIYVLHQNFPNPFNPATQITYVLPKSEIATIKVYDMLGKVVKILVDEYKTAGSYMVTFDAGDLSSGIYFYELQTANYSETKKMLLMR
jgi:hypothetical protein